MKFTLSIDCDNAAFIDESGFGLTEISRILAKVSDYLSSLDPTCCDHSKTKVMDDYINDINGNRVGSWTIRKE